MSKPNDPTDNCGSSRCSDATAYQDDPEWDDDMLYAFESAAGLMDQEEFGGENAERQEAAFREVAKRIRAMASRYNRRRERR